MSKSKKESAQKLLNNFTSRFKLKKGRRGKSYASFQMSKALKHRYTTKEVPKFRELSKKSLSIIFNNKTELFGITLIYGLLYLLLVKGAGEFNIAEIKDYLQGPESGIDKWWGQNALLAAVVLGGGTQTAGEGANVYGFFLLLIVSMAYVWALRHIYAKKKFIVRDAFYNGMYPFVPAILVFLVIFIAFIPMVIGNFLFTSIVLGGVATTMAENALVITLFVFTLILSGYFLTSTIIAFYIVMLPEMTPMKAFASARKIVSHRRWAIARRMIQLLISMILIIGLMLFVTIAINAEFAVLLMTLVVISILLFVHSFMYTLYRALI